MADDLLSVLTKFHRDIMLPDVERTVQDSERRVRDEALSHFDAMYKRFDRLETEYQALAGSRASKASLVRQTRQWLTRRFGTRSDS